MNTLRTVLRPVAALAATAALGLASAAYAQAGDPAGARIQSFEDTLLQVMKAGKQAGFKGREAKLRPVIVQTMDLPTMTRIAVGPGWAKLTQAQRDALIAAFTRFTVASYAHHFDDWTGQKFTFDKIETRGPDKLIMTHIVPAHDTPVGLAYRMRQSGGGDWKIIDVYYQGSVSELTTRRSDFATILANKGPDALAQHLNQLSDNLARK